MKANDEYLSQPMSFWANVRAISETIGYTERGKGKIKIPTQEEMVLSMKMRDLKTRHLIASNGKLTSLGELIQSYFQYRADCLDRLVEPNLMDKTQAKVAFEKLKKKYNPHCPLPMNKQKGKKKAFAYLTGIVNMIIESAIQGKDCDYDPGKLTTITRHGEPVRTLSRRIDGAFPSTVNPIAIWEIKEYYYTTTFGSRVADGIYETLLEGMELSELKEHENIKVLHYLIIDAHYTWWVCGKSYLCRILDSLHMGYIDEVLFGKEVIIRLPEIVEEWVALTGKQKD